MNEILGTEAGDKLLADPAFNQFKAIFSDGREITFDRAQWEVIISFALFVQKLKGHYSEVRLSTEGDRGHGSVPPDGTEGQEQPLHVPNRQR